ncbi:hypothetical protein [Acanthopleuribacter pedis]|uniref:Uncharacterized protein n=1 Tax=Acanthopleuribacter pedis TaxID=442870 RepID=A0A8J7U8G4_9BACT|nr:hypothetical protein [Acanthopleuribacter pedis]MBO1322521.1 hypothetical protein [Acanthopleuribacter pedis]
MPDSFLGLDRRRMAVPSGTQSVLKIFMADLLCFAPAADGRSLQVLAPNTPDGDQKHEPILFLGNAQRSSGTTSLRWGPEGWPLAGCTLRVENALGGLELNTTPLNGLTVPTQNATSLAWLANLSELHGNPCRLMAEPLAVAARFPITQGRITVCEHSVHHKGNQIRKIRFNRINQANTPAAAVPRCYGTMVLAEIPLSGEEVVLSRTPFDGAPVERLVLKKQAGEKEIVLAFANYGAAASSDPHSEKNHFQHYYQMVETSSTKVFVPSEDQRMVNKTRSLPATQPFVHPVLANLANRLAPIHTADASTRASITVPGYSKNCLPIVVDPPDGG